MRQVRRGGDTYDQLTEDRRVRLESDGVEQESDLVLFNLAEVICAYKESGVVWCEKILLEPIFQ